MKRQDNTTRDILQQFIYFNKIIFITLKSSAYFTKLNFALCVHKRYNIVFHMLFQIVIVTCSSQT